MRVRNGWQRFGIGLSLLWAICVSLWFVQHVPEVNGPRISSVYLQCIEEPNANRRDCKARAEWFREEARSEFRAGWPWFALGPVLIVWLLVYSVVWTARWIRRGLQQIGRAHV